jgi:tetratricopeptide (TPR) repeat protein
VIIHKAELALIPVKKRITTRTLYDVQQSLSSTLNESVRIDGDLTLPPISVKKSSVLPVKVKGISMIKSGNCNSKRESTLPLISSTNPINKDSFVEPAQIPFSLAETLKHIKDSEVRSQVHFSHPFRVVWLHSNNPDSNINYNYAIDRFRQSVHTIDIFTDLPKCFDFIQKQSNEKIILILSNDSLQSIVCEIHHLSQLHAIYIYQIPMPIDNQWIKSWIKIQDIFTDIEKICDRLEEETEQIRRNSISISISSIDLDRLDSSFMYTQLLKEVIIEMEDDDDKAKKEFIHFSRNCNRDKFYRMKIIDEFEQYYTQHTPIWWYTRDCFIHEMINVALRLQDINTIIQTRFFIRNLHKQIEQLYEPSTHKLTLYRGQGLSYGDFQQLRVLEGGLYSFHHFLSTSNDREVALTFASSARDDDHSIGIIFHIDIDPTSLKSALYASVDKVGYYTTENEILFTMHTVFRIGKIQKINSRLYQVHLSLTNDDDEDLKKLTENIRQATDGSTGWDRLGQLLLKMGKFDQAEEVYNVLIQNSSQDDLKGRAHHCHLLGLIKQQRNDHDNALTYFMKTLDIYQTLSDSRHLDFGTLYNNIGLVYQHKQDYTKAF